MSIRQDVFGLEQVYRLQVEGLWSAKSDVWLQTPQGLTNFGTGAVETFQTGYFGGGDPVTSVVDRIDYSNDTSTASPKGPLSLARNRLAATGNSSFGYFGGGNPGPRSTVDRIDYSNDTATASPKGPLSVARNRLAATGNSSFGYFGGGYLSYSTVDRIDYSNDTATASVRGPLSVARYSPTATGNQSYGYFGGGAPSTRSTVDRIDYSNDTATLSVRGPLSLARNRLAATGNSSYGYFAGGEPEFSTVDRIDYSNDTATASPKGPLSAGRKRLAATGNSSFGYFGGGDPGPRTTVDRIDYSNDTATASPKGPLSVARYGLAASSARANALPVTDTTLPPANSPTQYFPPTLFGYFGGGFHLGYLSIIDRIDYSNDTATASVRGPLNSGRIQHTFVGNSSFGYIAGGTVPPGSPGPVVSLVERIDYSNDTATASPKGPLSLVRFRLLGAVGYDSFGYIAGGTAPSASPTLVSTIDRIDYSNDTATASPKGPLSAGRNSGQGSLATGNASYGYFGGGGNPAAVSTVDRIDYSNDTATASPKGPLSVARGSLAATGNSSFGYFGGGFTPGQKSTVDRIDYSNDTATASPKGPLSLARFIFGATGNANFGYFGGGYPSTKSVVDRIDYSNDTATASPKGPLSASRGYVSATSAAENGLPKTQ